MRLSVIFLAVLALSAIVTSMAAWGITYGTSYSRLSTMALQFTALAQDSLAGFGSFVTDLLGGNSVLVESVLAAQEQSSAERTAETQAQMAQTIGVLVNYTANSTERTQQQMNGVVDAFGALMSTVVGQFKDLASGYVAQVRANLAVKGTAAILTSTGATLSAIQRFQVLINNGLLNLTRAPTDPVNEQDCTLLGVLCDTSTEVGLLFTLVSSTGRYYTCGSGAPTVTYRTSTATQYSEFQMNWFSFTAAQAAVPPKQRCLNEKPIVTTVGKNCTLPFNCTCGKDMRCYSWYQPFVNTTNTSYIGGVYPDPYLQMHTAMSLFDFSTTPATFLGIVDSTQTFAVTQNLLPSLPGVSNQTYMTLVLNDTYLTTLANGVRPCTAFTKPANFSLPTNSAFRSCDMGIRVVAQWIVNNRTSLLAPVTLEVDGILWDVTPVTILTSSYFFIVGSNKSESFQAIDASEAKASAQLAAVRSALTSQVAAAGVVTRDYVATLGAQNLLATQAMQETFLAQLWDLENASRVTLANSQARSTATSQQMTLAQTVAVESERGTELNIMNVTAGWTIAIVFCLLLAVLGLSAFGTTRVTNNLTHIIGLMEDVADMKVESLAIPQGSSVQEVARIQTAFEVLVLRIAEYKSYIPAGVFEKLRREKADNNSEDGQETDRRSSAGPETGRSKQQSPHHVSHSGTEGHSTPAHRPSVCSSRTPLVHVLGRRSATRPVAVLAINVVGTMDLLRGTHETASKIVLNEYVTLVHEAVLQGRGNIDFLSGDQIFVTFNAHVPCSDPPGSAMSVALDLKEQLLDKLGDKLKFRMGLSFGPVFSSTVGYTKFKFMASFGSPMKVSNVLAHLEGLDNGAILVDTNTHERMKYSFDLRPVEVVHLPWLKAIGQEAPQSQRVFLLLSKKKLQEDEWLYQVDQGGDASDWSKAFERLAVATAAKDLEGIVEEYLAAHPKDELALRLRGRLGLWTPGKGIAP